MTGQTDPNGVWDGWKSGVAGFKTALAAAGCITDSNASLLNDDELLELLELIEVVEAGDTLSELEKHTLRKQRIGHAQWAADIKSRAGDRCQVVATLARNLVAGHIDCQLASKSVQ
ncbi:MAG: hypothetical protein AAF098_15895 [Pseudomonadota bacterium]